MSKCSVNIGTVCKQDGTGLVTGKGCFVNGTFVVKYFDFNGNEYTGGVSFPTCAPVTPLYFVDTSIRVNTYDCDSSVRFIVFDVNVSDLDSIRNGTKINFTITCPHYYDIFNMGDSNLVVSGDTITVIDASLLIVSPIVLGLKISDTDCMGGYTVDIIVDNFEDMTPQWGNGIHSGTSRDV